MTRPDTILTPEAVAELQREYWPEMDDDTLDHLHAYVRRSFRTENVPAVYQVMVAALYDMDVDEVRYYKSAGWPALERALSGKIWEVLA